MRRLILSLAAAFAVSAFSAAATAARADDMMSPVVKAGDLEISAGWARAMLPSQPAGGGFVTITNNGAGADRLVGGSTPAAGKLEIHTMEVKNDVMVMRPVEGGLEIPAGGTVEMKPGGLHLMFMEVAKPFAGGETVPIVLEFEKAGKVEVQLAVKAGQGGGMQNRHGQDG